MSRDNFIERRQDHWQRLEELLGRAERDLTRLSEPELRDLGRLYHLVASDLALAQRDYPRERVTVYLNQLAGRAHAAVYQAPPLRWRQLREFYRAGFPALYRRLLPYTVLAFLLFLLPALAAFAAVWQQPDRIYVLLGPGVRETVHEVENGHLWTDIAPAVRSAASTAILTNNIQVMFLAFAGSITGGLFTAYIMLTNGLQIGALFGLLQYHGMSGGLAEFVVAHGFIELSVIFLTGGCGLYVGDALLRPGLLGRREALVQRGRTAVAAVLGCLPLLVLAGLIEGFVSPSSLHSALKLAVGLITGGALYAYWLRRAR